MTDTDEPDPFWEALRNADPGQTEDFPTALTSATDDFMSDDYWGIQNSAPPVIADAITEEADENTGDQTAPPEDDLEVPTSPLPLPGSGEDFSWNAETFTKDRRSDASLISLLKALDFDQSPSLKNSADFLTNGITDAGLGSLTSVLRHPIPVQLFRMFGRAQKAMERPGQVHRDLEDLNAQLITRDTELNLVYNKRNYAWLKPVIPVGLAAFYSLCNMRSRLDDTTAISVMGPAGLAALEALRILYLRSLHDPWTDDTRTRLFLAMFGLLPEAVGLAQQYDPVAINNKITIY